MEERKEEPATQSLENVTRIDESQARQHLDPMVRSTVEETLNL